MKSLSNLLPLFLFASTLQLSQGFTCPSFNSFLPCTCEEGLAGFYPTDISCLGPWINQTAMQKSFDTFRSVNDGKVEVGEFFLLDTNMTTFNLSLLFDTNFDHVKLMASHRLAVLAGPTVDSTTEGAIHTFALTIVNNPALTEQGLGNTFRYFNHSTVSRIDLSRTGITGAAPFTIEDGSGDLELLPGFSQFEKLERLTMNYNNVTRIGGGVFKRNALLSLSMVGCKINELGEDAFLMKPQAAAINITLDDNLLNENSFHNNTGLGQSGQNFRLSLRQNQLTTLPQPIFEPFLRANNMSELILADNPLTCDERVSWVKRNQADYEARVTGAFCSNDQGNTVFNSTLVPV